MYYKFTIEFIFDEDTNPTMYFRSSFVLKLFVNMLKYIIINFNYLFILQMDFH